MEPISKEESLYHNLGLLGELLSVGHFKVEHMAGVSAALNFIITERTAYESSNTPAQEEGQEDQAETNSSDNGSSDTGDLS